MKRKRPLAAIPGRLVCLVAVLSFLVAGCLSKPSCVVFVMFDISGSTAVPEIRQRYYQDFQKVLASLGGGELVLGDVITDNTMATLSFPVNELFPAYSPWTANPLMHRRKMQKAQEACQLEARRLILEAPPTPKTDILNAFQAADRRVFNGPSCKGVSRRVLVVFSDMIEQSDRFNFVRENLTKKRVQQIMAIERRERGLPNLRGVEVWVAGATAAVKGGLSAQRIHQIESFWRTYLKACGANLMSYGPRLLSFELPATTRGGRQ